MFWSHCVLWLFPTTFTCEMVKKIEMGVREGNCYSHFIELNTVSKTKHMFALISHLTRQIFSLIFCPLYWTSQNRNRENGKLMMVYFNPLGVVCTIKQTKKSFTLFHYYHHYYSFLVLSELYCVVQVEEPKVLFQWSKCVDTTYSYLLMNQHKTIWTTPDTLYH